jgi:hypothetical protein
MMRAPLPLGEQKGSNNFGPSVYNPERGGLFGRNAGLGDILPIPNKGIDFSNPLTFKKQPNYGQGLNGGMGGLGNILRTLGSLFGGSMGGGMMPSFGGGGMMPSFGRGLGGLFQQAPQADRPPRTNRPEVEELSDMTPMEQPDRPPRTNRPEVNSTRDILARAAMSPMEQPASRGGFLNPRPLPDNARMLRPRFGNGFGGGLGSMFSRF